MGFVGTPQSEGLTHSTQARCCVLQTGSLLSRQSALVLQPGCVAQTFC